MALLDLSELPLSPYEKYRDVVRGIGYDIANSPKIPEDEKPSLIKAVEKYFFSNGSFTIRHRSLLCRIQNEYHMGWLSGETWADSFWDGILSH